jgi:hypothetical protein
MARTLAYLKDEHYMAFSSAGIDTKHHSSSVLTEILIDLQISLLSENLTEFEHVEQFQNKGFSSQISLILEPVSKGLGFTVLPLYAAKAYQSPDLIKIHG